jgi:hypothetical protein
MLDTSRVPCMLPSIQSTQYRHFCLLLTVVSPVCETVLTPSRNSIHIYSVNGRKGNSIPDRKKAKIMA